MLELYGQYKPLRNHLKKVSLEESLRVIHRYSQHFQFGHKFDVDMSVATDFAVADYVQKSRLVAPWELEIIAKEIILNADQSSPAEKTMRDWNYFYGGIGKLKAINEVISGSFINSGNIIMELYRIAHWQFPWQAELPNMTYLTRYYKIYGHHKLKDIFQKKLGISVDKFYFVVMVLIGFFLEKVALYHKINVQVDGITEEEIKRALSLVSCEYADLKNIISAKQQFNQNYFYAFNPLKSFPLVRMQYGGIDSFVCPIPTFLFHRLTTGIFYDLVDEKEFGIPYGEAFQEYVGEVMKVTNGNKKSTKIIPEEEYGNSHSKKRTIDWIFERKDCALFIECKAKRLRAKSKETIDIADDLKKDLNFLADAIVQSYKSIRDYSNGEYPSYSFDSSRKIFPLIVTLENWYLFGDKVLGEIHSLAKEGFAKEGLDVAWLETMPYSICSIQDFETMMRILEKHDIEEVVEAKVKDAEMKSWDYAGFFAAKFKEYQKSQENLFPDELDNVYPESLRDKMQD